MKENNENKKKKTGAKKVENKSKSKKTDSSIEVKKEAKVVDSKLENKSVEKEIDKKDSKKEQVKVEEKIEKVENKKVNFKEWKDKFLIKLKDVKDKISSINFKEAIKDKRVIGVIASILILILIVVIYFVFFNYKRYKIEDLLEFNIDGFSGYATIEANIKEEYLYTDISHLLESSSISFSKDKDIANNDEIIVRINIHNNLSKQYKIKIKEEYKMVVSGLEEAVILDLFKDLSIGCVDKSPYLKLSFSNEELDTEKYNIRYSVESLDKTKDKYYIQKGWFYNGEKIKITASYNKDLLEENGYIVLEDSNETAVPNQDEYITSKEQLSDAVKENYKKLMLEAVKKYAEPSVMKRIYCNTYYCSNYAGASDRVEDYNLAKDPEFLYMYLGIKQNVRRGTVYDDFTHTAIIAGFRLSFTGDDNNKISGGKHYMYCNVHFDNMYLKKDGSISDYTTEENYVRCSTSRITESDIKNSDVTGKYKYSELINLSSDSSDVTSK